MGRLPFLRNAYPDRVSTTGAFRGLNTALVIRDDEFADMENMSTDEYPAVAVRKPRGEVQRTLEKPNGLFYKNGLSWVDGTSWYYKGEKIADVADGRKQIAGMGAYMVLFPDKLMYNTSTGELKHLEASWTQTAAASFAQTTEGSTMVKVTSAGIGKAFEKFDGVEMSGCTNAEFNKSFVVQEKADDYMVLIGALEEGFSQAKGLTIKRTVPDMDFVCENENRLWGCSSAKHELYASKLGDPVNWQAFEGISTDSYAVTVGSDGDFTGCVSHLGYVIFFKEDTIHTVFGDKPSNFKVQTSTPVRGIAKGMERTRCIVNETLLYASRDDICSYDGAQPESAGKALKAYTFTSGVASHYNGKYYASLLGRDGRWGLYVYDLESGIWMKEDDLHLVDMVYGDGELYCVDDVGNLFTVSGSSQETIPWYLESGDLMEGSVEYKHVKKLQFHMKLEPGSEVSVYLMYDDNGMWEFAKSFRAKNQRTHVVPVIPRRCQKYRYRIEGVGAASLIAVTRKYGGGSENDGGF